MSPQHSIAHYRVVSKLGEGGMGAVYRATDTRLNRDVAIKVLPAALTKDPERLARFEREGKVLASLNHPNIAQIYGLEQAGESPALVMELVAGQTLSVPQPLPAALRYAKQIAEALEAAHEKGITHRDLKPANIMITADGTVKVLDFGLASVPATDSVADPTNSPTMTLAATQTGVIMGTAAYMSPEQAAGKTVDKRSDIWSFGVVLWEMLTGARLFDGETLSHTLAHVLTAPIDFNKLPSSTPRPIATLLRRCLDRDPRQRLRDIGEARIAIENYLAHPDRDDGRSPSATQKWMWPVIGALTLGVVALALTALRAPAAGNTRPLEPVSLLMDLSPAEMLASAEPIPFLRPSRTAVAISPDGRTIVYGGLRNNETMLYRRGLADSQPVPIDGTTGAVYPFFSPDGQSIGFVSGKKLEKVALAGGLPVEICDVSGPIWGAAWGIGGVIVFASDTGLSTVQDGGGTPSLLIASASSSWSEFVTPLILPDGKTLLFTSRTSFRWEDSRLDAIRLDNRQRKTVLTNASDARYFPTGHLLFIRNATLYGISFDTARVETRGAAVPLVPNVMHSANAPNGRDESGMGQFALSGAGALVYAAGGTYPTPETTLVRVDPKGAQIRLATVRGRLFGPRLTADGSRVVAYLANDGSRAADLWSFAVPSGTATRLTSTGDALWPLPAPDGKSVTYSRLGRNNGIYSLPLDGSGAPTRIVDTQPGKDIRAASWSPDGKWLAYLEGFGRFVVKPMQGAGDPLAFRAEGFSWSAPQFSPDGRWIAYTSDESGTVEVYAQAFPGPGEKHRISSSGGDNPAWSRDGRELYYLRPGARTGLWAVEVSTTSAFHAGSPHMLFEGPYGSSTLRSYDPTPDGRFIMVGHEGEIPDQKVTRLNVVLNWAEDLKRRVR